MNSVRAGSKTDAATRRRYRLDIEGVVQGVGFRPYVYRLASDLGLAGTVSNSSEGVTIEIEGPSDVLDAFVDNLTSDPPLLARVDRVRRIALAPKGQHAFKIDESSADSRATTLVSPDIATCSACLTDVFNPRDRRYRYPFTNCTDCGPRFSIIESLPYDRARTTMASFTMCGACAAEFSDPSDRRFHAQPIACPICGPHIGLRDKSGLLLAERDEALCGAAEALRGGKIVALKGLGGYQLLVDARNNHAVSELRRRKRRPDKPFAVMFPSNDAATNYLNQSALERELLASKEAPIVLIRSREQSAGGGPPLCEAVAPGNPDIGAMLPCTPLHHLLMAELQFPIVATSGNVADEPMIIGDNEAIECLGGVADRFITHDRGIASAVDDSVLKVVADRELMLRRGRGYAPWTFDTGRPMTPLVAYGGHLKSSCAVTTGSHVILGPHVGDLESARARHAWHRSLDHLMEIHQAESAAVACDSHPDYYTTRAAMASGAKVVPVQHHVAHVAACMAENRIEGPVLGVVWDGTGYGGDGTIWGGEFILVDGTSARRVAHLRPFRLPGGDAAVRGPVRSKLGVLYETFDRCLPESLPDLPKSELRLYARMLSRGINSPLTSSVGRLFDAAACITGLICRASFEGQAAMALEHAIGSAPSDASYEFPLVLGSGDGPIVIDWVPAIRIMLSDVEREMPVAYIASAFHNGLIQAIVDVAIRVGETRVALTGGCFQNRYLTENAVNAIRLAGLTPYWHRWLPPNDGGLAAGQAAWAARRLEEET